MAVREYSWESVIRGHHVYKAIWTPEIGEFLKCKQKRGNLEDLHTVSIIKDDTIVGRVPREKLRVVLYFLEHDGTVTCQVTETPNFSLSNCVSAVPCILCTGFLQHLDAPQTF